MIIIIINSDPLEYVLYKHINLLLSSHHDTTSTWTNNNFIVVEVTMWRFLCTPGKTRWANVNGFEIFPSQLLASLFFHLTAVDVVAWVAVEVVQMVSAAVTLITPPLPRVIPTLQLVLKVILARGTAEIRQQQGGSAHVALFFTRHYICDRVSV